MSELEYSMVCPNCKEKVIMMFSGSGTKGVCMSCGKHLPPEQSYQEYEGTVIAYTG